MQIRFCNLIFKAYICNDGFNCTSLVEEEFTSVRLNPRKKKRLTFNLI